MEVSFLLGTTDLPSKTNSKSRGLYDQSDILRNEKLLESKKISRIVNCTHNIENYFPNKCQYYNIPIGKWRLHHDESDQSQLWAFLAPYLQFVKESVEGGENVLLHCLAGAHRAGTAAVLAVMFLTDMDSQQVEGALDTVNSNMS